MITQELTYWVTLSLIPKMWTKRKNEIFVNCYTHTPQISIIELFDNPSFWDELGMTDEEKTLFAQAKNELSNNSFLVEDLIAQGYDIIPIVSKEYPKALKDNLKIGAPTLIYTKGNKSLLHEPSVAIVGSRNADATSITFTDNVAKKVVSNGNVVVSGFAKGVDKQALDSALEINGKSIIVLPQGITTFGGGYKEYYKHIAQGRVLVMSVFAPKAPWTVEFAMARNPIIYGMASEIYVAQSDSKGGTWAGAIDGIRKKRNIYVRYPEKGENNANMQLIQKGGCPVDSKGNVLALDPEELKTPEEKEIDRLNACIITILNNAEMVSPADMLAKLNVEWGREKLNKHLSSLPGVEKIKEKNKIYFRLAGKGASNLFSTV